LTIALTHSVAGATEQGIAAVSSEKYRGGAGLPHRLVSSSLPGSAGEAAIDPHSREISDPNDRKHNDDGGEAKAKHKPDIVPNHALPSLPRRDHPAALRSAGRTHLLLIFDYQLFSTVFFPATNLPNCRFTR